MLILLRNENTGTVFYLKNQREFIVGRKDCDILIGNDQSISRKHAKLIVNNDHVTLEDLGSKYKTTHNGKELPPNAVIRLQNNDKIHFGIMSSQFIFEQHTLVTTGTRLTGTQKAKLKQDLVILGAQFIDQWTGDCTHLTVEEITLTVKVLQALIDERPIVVPKYWSKFAECVLSNSPPPNIEDYNNPPMAEALLNKVEIKANLQRKGMFEGKVFIFSKEMNKQQMEDVIKKLGGSALSWDKNPLPLEDITKSPKEFLIIQTPDKIEDPSLNEIIKLLSKKGKRTIPLQEIAMAIVHASCEKDCNPNFNRAAEVFQTTRAREPTQNNALVPNTESEVFNADICRKAVDIKNIIPDTFETNWDVPPIKIERVVQKKTLNKGIEKENIEDSSKRTRNEQTNENPFKKMKTDKGKTIVPGGSKEIQSQKPTEEFMTKPSVSEKRKAEDDLNTTAAKRGVNVNPFATIMKNSKKGNEVRSEVHSKNINPFSLLMKSNENITQVSDKNPFKPQSRKKDKEHVHRESPMFSNTRVEDRSPEKQFNYSRISKSSISDLNSTWFSKKNSFEIKVEDENHYDTEMQSFIDSFKNKVVVEVMASVSIRPRITRDNIDGVVSSSVSNFKKFKKILPLHPQNKIIGKDNFVAMIPGNTTSINDTRRDLQNDSDDESGRIVSKKRPPKKFFI